MKSSSCSSVGTGATATLRYAIYPSVAYHMGYDHTNRITPSRFYLWKSATSECIQIPQFGSIGSRCHKFHTAVKSLLCMSLHAMQNANKICVVFHC